MLFKDIVDEGINTLGSSFEDISHGWVFALIFILILYIHTHICKNVKHMGLFVKVKLNINESKFKTSVAKPHKLFSAQMLADDDIQAYIDEEDLNTTK